MAPQAGNGTDETTTASNNDNEADAMGHLEMPALAAPPACIQPTQMVHPAGNEAHNETRPSTAGINVVSVYS